MSMKQSSRGQPVLLLMEVIARRVTSFIEKSRNIDLSNDSMSIEKIFNPNISFDIYFREISTMTAAIWLRIIEFTSERQAKVQMYHPFIIPLNFSQMFRIVCGSCLYDDHFSYCT